MATPISRGSIVDALVSRIRDDVVSGRYPPGSYLPSERDLAAAYQVTRTSLKHAIVRLVQAGLLETKHGVGTRVRDYERLGGPELLPMLIRTAGPGWIGEIFEVRREIGMLVAGRAAANADPEHRTRLRALHTAVAEAADAAAAQHADCEVHRVLAAASGNRVYGLLVNGVLNAYMEVAEALREPFTDPARAADRLAPLIEAVCAGDVEAARGAAEAYLRETGALMLGGIASAPTAEGDTEADPAGSASDSASGPDPDTASGATPDAGPAPAPRAGAARETGPAPAPAAGTSDAEDDGGDP